MCSKQRLRVNADEEFCVVLCASHVFEKEVDCFLWVHVAQIVSEEIHAVYHLLGLQQVLTACAAGNEVDGRIDALVGKCAVELQFHVARTLELFKDYFVHL